MKRFILVTLTIFAVIFAIGSVGAYDNNNIGFGQLLIQVGISILVEWFSLATLNKNA